MTQRGPSIDPSIDLWKVLILLVSFVAVVAGALTWTSAPWGAFFP